ncbi:MAG: MFS transporter [Promethearchaeota archaeon]
MLRLKSLKSIKSVKSTAILDQESSHARHMKKMEQNILKLYIMRMFASIHFFGSVMILFFEDWGQISFTEIMILEAFFTGGIFLLEVPTGTIADKFSRRSSLILSHFVEILAILIYVSTPNFYVFALAEITWALAVALHSGAFDAIVYDTLVELKQEKRSKHIMSRMQIFGLSTMIIRSISGGIIAQVFGLRVTMLYSAVPLVIAFGISLSLEEPSTHQESKKDKPWEIFRKGCANIKQNRSLQKLIADSVVISVIAYYILWIWQKRMMVLDVNVNRFGFIHSGMILAQILLLNLFRPLERLMESKGWNRVKLAVVKGTAVGTGIGFLLMGLFNTTWVVILGTLLGAGFGLSRRTILNNYMQKHIASEQRATTISTVSMIRMVILLCLNIFVGFAVEWNMQATLIGLGVLAVVWGVISRVTESDLHD